MFTMVMKTKEYLSRLGVEVELFDIWKRYDWSVISVIHVFGADMRNYFLLRALPSSVPLVVSPIIDTTYPPVFARVLTTISCAFPPQVITSYKSYALAFRKADIVVARSSHEQRMLEKGFGVKSERIRIVHNGVDEKFLYAKSELFYSKYGLRDFVLYVGQIGNPRKNLLCLLRVAQLLADVEFVLVGPILETSYAQRVISLARKLRNVHVLGRIPEEELTSAYAACKVFVLPSLTEGTGLAALEAGLAGANLVVTKRGGTLDYFKDYAIMVEPTTDSILKGIRQALERPRDERQRTIIIENFLWPRVAQRLLNVYEEIV